MNELNCKNRTLFAQDNLDVLSDASSFPDNCIDLIYLDPPFNSQSKYNLPFPKKYKKREDLQPVMAFNDTWSWTDECTQYLESLEKGSLKDRNLADLVKLTRRIRNEKVNTKDSMSAYLINMAVRLLQMKRVLKTSGSIYLHCDPTASHYLKLMMDNVFGRKNFRNECVWAYRTGGASNKQFSKKHDILLYYALPNGTFNVIKEKSYTKAKGRKPGVINYGGGEAEFFEDDQGVYNLINLRDVWDISYIGSTSHERLGYPTQKPIELLTRVIQASSNKGDIVLDPFCGCGTTVHAAENLGRRWVGIDISQFSNGLIRNRLIDNFPILSKQDIEIRGNPITISDAVALAKRDKFEFEKWVCGEIGAEGMYHAPGSRGADGGVDGIIPFYFAGPNQRRPELANSIVQVKGGHVSPDSVKALSATIKLHKDGGSNSVCGVFVCFEKYMRTVENNRDRAKVKDHLLNQQFDYIQAISVEDLLKGKQPYFPGGYRKKAA